MCKERKKPTVKEQYSVCTISYYFFFPSATSNTTILTSTPSWSRRERETKRSFLLLSKTVTIYVRPIICILDNSSCYVSCCWGICPEAYYRKQKKRFGFFLLLLLLLQCVWLLLMFGLVFFNLLACSEQTSSETFSELTKKTFFSI